MKKIALITCEDLTGFVTDEHHLETALKKREIAFDWIPWRQKTNWDEYGAAIVRTPWDYAKCPQEFLSQMKMIADSSCRLLNSFEILKWNADKTYLRDLAEKGVRIIPTLWSTLESFDQVKGFFEALESPQIVIKPQIGAGGVNTFLLGQDEPLDASVNELLNCPIMVQPFMKQVQKEGEYSAHYFNKKFSHCILKTPKQGEFKSQEEYGSQINVVDLTEGQKNFCKTVLDKICEPWLFARVDFINSEDGHPCLIELELIEPSLYFRYKEGSAEFLVDQLSVFV